MTLLALHGVAKDFGKLQAVASLDLSMKKGEDTEPHRPQRGRDTHQFGAKTSKAHGRFQIFKFYWQTENKYVLEVATKHRIPVVPVYAAFKRPNGDNDPQGKRLVTPDKIDPTAQGNDLIARLFREFGYQYATP